jgi:hypothetical protein
LSRSVGATGAIPTQLDHERALAGVEAHFVSAGAFSLSAEGLPRLPAAPTPAREGAEQQRGNERRMPDELALVSRRVGCRWFLCAVVLRTIKYSSGTRLRREFSL